MWRTGFANGHGPVVGRDTHSECSVSVRNHDTRHCVSSLGLKVLPEQLCNFLHSSSPLSAGLSLHVTHQSNLMFVGPCIIVITEE